MIYQFAKVLVQIFIIVLLTAVYGQSQPPSPGLPDRESDNTFKAMKSRSSELERLRRVNTSPRENEPQLNLPLIYKDFNKIQLINTEKLQKNNAAGNLNFPAIAKASKDIKKRAMRLKSNLFPTSKNEDLKIELKEDFRVERLNG
ncbi:MAG: hypothetical protein ABJA66_20405, partial [Actinomycetota bacterium]